MNNTNIFNCLIFCFCVCVLIFGGPKLGLIPNGNTCFSFLLLANFLYKQKQSWKTRAMYKIYNIVHFWGPQQERKAH